MPTLKVTLKTINGVKTLDVDDANQGNHIGQSSQAQTIVWQLEGEAASGSFNPLNDPKPGFAWKTTNPAPTPFTQLARNPNGNQITVSDLNNSASTQGTWVYQLYVTVGNQVYSTTATSPMATSNNPTIKNT